jgi:hypothetical protein
MTENDKERQRTTASPSDKPAIISLSKHNLPTNKKYQGTRSEARLEHKCNKEAEKQLSKATKAMQAIISHMKMSFETWPSLHKLKVAVPAAFHLFTLQGSNNIIRATSFNPLWVIAFS